MQFGIDISGEPKMKI
jgi:hypothetical protein